MSVRACAIVLAAGEGRRMGQDKALLELCGQTAVERVVGACERGGVRHVIVVRRPGAKALPARVGDRVQVVEAVDTAGMIDSLRAGIRARPDDAEAILIFPVDHALVGHEVVATVLAQFREGGPAIVLPLWQERPGHPIGLATAIEGEILDPRCASLRGVIRARPERVAGIAVSNSWVRRDLDNPEDLAAARLWLDNPENPFRSS